jgi:hypothetical protein
MNLTISIYDILYCNIANTKAVRHPVQMDKHTQPNLGDENDDDLMLVFQKGKYCIP